MGKVSSFCPGRWRNSPTSILNCLGIFYVRGQKHASPTCWEGLENPVSPSDSPVSPPESLICLLDIPVTSPDGPVFPPDGLISPPDSPLSPSDSPVSPPDKLISSPDRPVSSPDCPVSQPDRLIPSPDRSVSQSQTRRRCAVLSLGRARMEPKTRPAVWKH